MAQERATTLSTLWFNVFTACNMDVPWSTDETTDFLVMALCGRHAAQDRFQTLRAHNVELRAAATSVKVRLSQACGAATHMHKDKEIFQQQGSGG